MIRQVRPEIRMGLVQARITSMTSSVQDALDAIAKIRAIPGNSVIDIIALGTLETEIFYLDLQPQKAMESFSKNVESLLVSIEPRVATLISDNKTLLGFEVVSKDLDNFYHLVDQRRILGLELRDHAAVLLANMEAAQGKHYESLPIFWKQLCEAYNNQNWRAQVWAESDFARECSKLGWHDEAVYHAMLSREKEVMESATKELLASRSIEKANSSLDKLLGSSLLKKHATEVARFISIFVEGIPEEHVKKVTTWLRIRAPFVPDGWKEASHFEQIWNAIGAFARRMDATAAKGFINIGLTHPLMSGGIQRKHLIDAFNRLIRQVQGSELAPLAEKMIQIAGDTNNEIDYADILNLLCNIATLGGKDLKAKIQSSLLPPGIEIEHPYLLQAARHLGWMPQHPEKLRNGARISAVSLRKQVEHLKANEKPSQIGGYGTLSQHSPDGHVVVHIHGAEHSLHALVPYLDLLDDESVNELVHAMLTMIANNENIISNRDSLASLLRRFITRLPKDSEKEVARVLEPIAEGIIEDQSIGQKHSDNINPLNPFKMGQGNPIDLQGEALHTLAVLDRHRPSSTSRFHHGLLLKALTSTEARLRQHGLLAAEQNGKLSRSEQMLVALAGLDGDTKVAGLALRALARAADSLRFTISTWHMAMRGIEAAVQSQNGEFRWAAAKLVTKLADKKIPQEIRHRLDAATASLRSDFEFSVRSVFEEKNPASSTL